MKTKPQKAKQKKPVHKKKKKSPGQVIKLTLQLALLLFLLVIAAGMFYFYKTYGKTLFQIQAEAKDVVSTSTKDDFRSSLTSLVYDTEGELIASLKADKDVYYIEYKDIPANAINAMVVTEDKKFMEHDGIDYLANIRAAIALIKNKGEIKQGASTITQQLARNIFLTHEVTYERKIEEIFIAQELEKKYSKQEILEFYFNNIYFANGHYGIQAAAYGYFGKSVTRLSLSQTAFLCAIPNSPNRYNPITNMENTLERRDRILNQMLEDDKINLLEYRKAINEDIELQPSKKNKENYVETYVSYSAIRALMENQGFEFRVSFSSEKEKEVYEDEYNKLYYSLQKELYRNGYRIYTSIDLKKQKLLQASLDQTLQDFTEMNGEGVFELQGAAVSIDNDTGRVIAIVGGRSQEFPGYTLNRAYQSYRQPGSSIKPLIVYTPALERDYTPDSVVRDERFEGGPRNSGGSYAGEMKLSRAIELSKNTIAWRLFEELTPEVGLSYLLDMNFAKIDKNDYYPAASLGGFTVGVSPLEMASAYAAIENDGYYRHPTCIVKIMDSEGNEIVGEKIPTKQVYETNAARIMTEALIGVIKNGTGKGLGLTHTISAGKTGTTDDKKDGWFVGYTPYYTTSVWVGYDIPKTLEDLKGSSYPGTIWRSYMEQIHNSSMTDTFETYDWRAVIKEEQEKEDEQAEREQEREVTNEMEQEIEQEAEREIGQEDEQGVEREIGQEDEQGAKQEIEQEVEQEIEQEDGQGVEQEIGHEAEQEQETENEIRQEETAGSDISDTSDTEDMEEELLMQEIELQEESETD
ncbi:PBP1A family penicillin-binding protein [Mobilitalea sibirica]|uniref:Penicillin-binding protein 1A n=2 Tax=Mobilitalea sibirica TaxID=1462919 RepID=A0A8J7H639_9FIRM|nr:PBP1A family penicillin-binding protein [Mobilitalea sibirica]